MPLYLKLIETKANNEIAVNIPMYKLKEQLNFKKNEKNKDFNSINNNFQCWLGSQTKHVVGEIEDFDREKYITIHASIESDWSGDHISEDIRSEFLNTYDVYLGRETGGLKGALNRVKEDPNRKGFADVLHIKKLGQKTINSYKNKDLKQYDNRLNNMVIGSQFRPIWPDGSKTQQGWSLSQKDTEQEPLGTASGEYMAHYIKEFFSSDKKRPKFIEVINEPMWDLIPRKNRGIADKENEAVQKMAKFHSSVAREIKKINPDVLVGGFTILNFTTLIGGNIDGNNLLT